MMKYHLLKIKSITDVITNSSTEVFLLKNTNAFKELNDSLRSLKADYIFDTEEVLKEYLSDCYAVITVEDNYLSDLQSLEFDRIRDFRTKHGGYVDRI